MLKNLVNNRLIVVILFLNLLIISCSKPISSDNISEIDFKVDSILKMLTLEEKIGQMTQVSSSYGYDPESLKNGIKSGNIGSVLNESNPKIINKLQKIALEESPHGIPLIIGRDVIHGFKTIFPIPLAQAATWNLEKIEEAAHFAAKESRLDGINWTFSPMVDVSRDARWGRIAESYGEDTYLTAVMGVATVKGYQGNDLSSRDRIAACIKHFAAYGAAEGGRDYNTVSLSPVRLRNVYLPSYKACADAGAVTLMTSFNDVNGIPSTENKMLLTDVLRNEWGFKGFIVTDWASITEMMNHGVAENEYQCAYLAANAGVDMEMATLSFRNNLPQLIKENKISEDAINDAVRRILRVKFRLGLFDNPYAASEGLSENEKQEGLDLAKEIATESVVLLKNKNNVLPLDSSVKKVLVVGPMADDVYEQLGTWIFDGDTSLSVTPLDALRNFLGEEKVEYLSMLRYSRDKEIKDVSKCNKLAAQSDVIIAFVGEEAILSGEAHSRANINLPGAQEELIKKLSETGKPVITVIMSGRPNALGPVLDYSDGLFLAMHQGSMAGPAITNLLFGMAIPSGKLPVSIPKSGGQCPIYYSKKNTGRPTDTAHFTPFDEIPIRSAQTSLGNQSHYLDDGYGPQFPFGYGLSYTSFNYSDINLSKNEIQKDDSLIVSVNVTNTGKYEAAEVVQLYVRDLVGTITRPVKELKGFKKIVLKPDESQKVVFTIKATDLAYYTSWNNKTVENGKFDVWIGPDSEKGDKKSFELK